MTYTIILGNKNYSSWSMRGWLALKQTDAPFEEVLLNLGGADIMMEKAQHTRAGRVPELKHGELAIWDSLAIAEYLAERHADYSLWPQDPSQRAWARSLCAEMHAGFVALREHWPMNIRARIDRPATKDVARDIARIQTAWSRARQAHQAEGPFLFGSWCLADAFFAPVVMRFITYGATLQPDCQDYLRAILEQEWVKEWCASAEAEEWVYPRFEF